MLTLADPRRHEFARALASRVMGWPEVKRGQLEPALGFIDYQSHLGVRRQHPHPLPGVDEYYGIATWDPMTSIALCFDDLLPQMHSFHLNDMREGVRGCYAAVQKPVTHALFHGDGETFPLAICEAILKAYEVL